MKKTGIASTKIFDENKFYETKSSIVINLGLHIEAYIEDTKFISMVFETNYVPNKTKFIADNYNYKQKNKYFQGVLKPRIYLNEQEYYSNRCVFILMPVYTARHCFHRSQKAQ